MSTNPDTTTGAAEVQASKPLSRAQRRAEAARLNSDNQQGKPEGIEHDTGTQAPQPARPIQLKSKTRTAKTPFATQLYPETVARLDWIKARGYLITETVDDAINAYLDQAGIPKPAPTAEHGSHLSATAKI